MKNIIDCREKLRPLLGMDTSVPIEKTGKEQNREFELAVAFHFLKPSGHVIDKITKQTGDKGKDIETTVTDKNGIKFPTIVECKWYGTTSNVTGPEMMKFASAKRSDKRPISKRIFISAHSFTKDAVEEAEEKGIEMIDGNRLYRELLDMKKESVGNDLVETQFDSMAMGFINEIYRKIKEANPNIRRHDLNVFMARMIFCFYAESTELFEKISGSKAFFHHFFHNETGEKLNSGKILGEHINKFFEVLNLDPEKGERSTDIEKELRKLPYVNGGLFKEKEEKQMIVFDIPLGIKELIQECSLKPWREINPDIFGSMFQAVVSENQRSEQGQHYTSIENIKKVLMPLFMDELENNYVENENDPEGLKNLLNRLAKIRVFDPACGSGNFLIIAYKLIRKLEIKILKQLDENFSQESSSESLESRIKLEQFVGIELDDFAREIATLSLWIAEHQMNLEFFDKLESPLENLPLKESAFKRGNALTTNWEEACPKDDAEIYIVGNPPFFGNKKLLPEQKEDMKLVFKGQKGYKKLDYVAGWIKKASEFIKGTNAKFSFVSTNSIYQGEQVIPLWSNILQNGQSIEFAHESFMWSNGAKDKAAVAVNITGVANDDNIKEKIIFSGDGVPKIVNNISPYIRDEKTMFVEARSKPLSKLMPKTIRGNEMLDDGNLSFDERKYKAEIEKDPNILSFIRTFLGANEFINGIKRYCFWITDENKNDALKVPFIKERVDECRKYREKSTQPEAHKANPWEFTRKRCPAKTAFMIPKITTKQRQYIPMGYFDDGTLFNNTVHAVFDAEKFVFGIISSRMHVLWVNETSAEMGNSGFSYSTKFSYNTFPFPDAITEQQKQEIEDAVDEVLKARKQYPHATISQLYSQMPLVLKKTHRKLDRAIEKCFREEPFTDDRERVEFLYAMYKKKLDETPGLLELDKTPDIADIDGK